MQFVVVEPGQGVPDDDYEGAFLIKDNWNDWGYVTTFDLRIKRRAQKPIAIGSVRIAHVDMIVRRGEESFRRTADRLLRPFESLDEGFFSLSLLDSYYENLNALGARTRIEILTSLRDVAYESPERWQRLTKFEVFRKSLIRDVRNPEAELERLHLIANGRERVVDFEWNYAPPRLDGSDREPPPLRFRASPASRPPSNVHALIGRNGVGKTRMMQAMARGVVSGEIDISQTASRVARVRTNVIVVSFSAFDDFVWASESSTRIAYIGLRHAEDVQRLKTSQELSEEFAKSLATARIGARRMRWDRILAILRYPESGFLEDFAGDLNGLLAEGRDGPFKDAAVDLFRPLSSGHKIALLTLTRLVEEVTERTIIFVDEPEAHLQPPLLSAFVRALSDFLSEVNGMAVVATHSPVVLQEVPASCVYKLRRYGDRLIAERPQMETYGENVSELTHEAFGLESTATGFYAALRRQVSEGRSYQDILDDYGSLGSEARGLLRVLTLNHGGPFT